MEEAGGSCPACRTAYTDNRVTTGKSVRTDELDEDKNGNLNTFALLAEEGWVETEGGDDEDAGATTVEPA
jgi:hypothetical protein